MASTHRQQTYDHRLRDLVGETGDVDLAIGLGVPRSTAAGWVRRDREPVVTLSTSSTAWHDLEVEVHRLRARVQLLTVLLRVVVSAMRALRVTLVRARVPEGHEKRRLLRAVDRARGDTGLRRALSLIGLSRSRYHAWRRRERRCELELRPEPDDRGAARSRSVS